MNPLREAAQQALEALLTPSGAQACSTCQNGPENEYCCRMEMWSAITALRAALAQQDEPVAADALTEPKSGDKWRVEWWNESCRMMLPAHAKLDSFVAYKNGTIQFTIKRTAA